MFDYSISKLFRILPRSFALNISERDPNAALQVVVTIKQFDKGRDRQMFLDWLHCGAKQFSDGHYTITPP